MVYRKVRPAYLSATKPGARAPSGLPALIPARRRNDCFRTALPERCFFSQSAIAQVTCVQPRDLNEAPLWAMARNLVEH